MPKAEYIRKINKSSMIIMQEKDCSNERESMEMFHYNEIPYFLKMEKQRQDSNLQFQYDITGKRSLGQLLEYKQLNYAVLQKILKSLDQACMQTEDFMLTENDILLEPDFVFSDHNMEHMCYCYFPGNQTDICRQFERFMEYLLQQLDHTDDAAMKLAYGVYQKVVQECVSLHDVLEDEGQLQELYQVSVNKSAHDYQAPVNKEPHDYQIPVQKAAHDYQVPGQKAAHDYQAPVNKEPHAVQDEVRISDAMEQSSLKEDTLKIKQKESLRQQAAEKLKRMLKKKIYTNRVIYPEENTVFEAEEEELVYGNPTVCLVPETDEVQNQFVYQGADRSRDFRCTQGKMLLGSDVVETDICIPFPMVSRIHARVEIDRKGTFLEDLNSTNGTHVNGELLQYREKRMLQKGDMISLAGECYSFH